MKIKLYIVTYKNDKVLIENLISLSNSDLCSYEHQVTIINNHSDFNVSLDYDINVRVIHNDVRPDFSTGFLARDWNFALIDGFRDLNNPDCDIVSTCQNDTIFYSDWVSRMIKYHEKYDFIQFGIGDNYMSWTPEGVKRIGLFDENFSSFVYQETDYCLMAVSAYPDGVSINDTFVQSGHWNCLLDVNSINGKCDCVDTGLLSTTINDVIDVEYSMNNEEFTRCSRNMLNKEIGRSLIKRKWGIDYNNYQLKPLIPKLERSILYSYFEKDIHPDTLKKFKYIGFERWRQEVEGLNLNQEIIFEYPDISSISFLPNGFDYDENICDDLEHSLQSGDVKIVESELDNVLRQLKGDEYPKVFFDKFIDEYGLELKYLNKVNDNSTLFKEGGVVVNDIDVKSIKNKLQSDIDFLLNSDVSSDSNQLKYGFDRCRAYRRKVDNYGDEVCDLIFDGFRSSGIVDIASQFLNVDVEINHAVLMISAPNDISRTLILSDKNYKPKTINMHQDPKTGTVKSIVYLNDVTIDDGPFCCIPDSSNRLRLPLDRLSANANSTNFLDNESERNRFMNLPERMRNHSMFGSLVDDNTELSTRLLSKEVPILSDDGNVITFDPSIIHRGGLCVSGIRIALQVIMREKPIANIGSLLFDRSGIVRKS